MIIEQSIRPFILAEPSITALIGSSPARLYLDHLPQNPTYPALTYLLVVDSLRPPTHDATFGPGMARLQFSSWAPTYGAARAVDAALETALLGFRGVMGPNTVQGVFFAGRVSLFESDETLQVYQIATDYRFHFTG